MYVAVGMLCYCNGHVAMTLSVLHLGLQTCIPHQSHKGGGGGAPHLQTVGMGDWGKDRQMKSVLDKPKNAVIQWNKIIQVKLSN